MVNSAKKEAAYQSALNSQTDIPLKIIMDINNSPGHAPNDHLKYAEMSENSPFTIDDETENENGKVSIP
jgi:hypothetical protein